LVPGGVVGDGRYRLLTQFGADRRGNAQFWRARDGQLNRDSALTILVGDPGDPQAGVDAGRTLERAMHAATFTHPGVARVLDVLSLGNGVLPGQGMLGIIVAEWTHGTDLLDVVSDGAVPPNTASRLLEPLASAVESAHHVGLVLGIDHPQRVRVTPDGTLRLAFPGPLAMATLRDDVKGLGALLYLLLTGRWALADGPEAVPAALTGPDGAVLAPGALNANVPGELSSIAVRSLEDTSVGGIRTSAAILQVLDRVAAEEAAAAAAAAAPEGTGVRDDGVWLTKKPRQDSRTRKRLLVAVAILAVLTLAIVVWIVTSVIGFFSNSSSGGGGPVVTSTSTVTSTPVSTATPTPTSTTAAVGGPIKPAGVTVYDVGGSADSPSKVGRVVDGDPTTVWRTDQYRQQFPSSLKQGIGIMATFSQPVTLAEIDIDSPSAGTVIEIRTATTAVPHLADTTVIGSGTLTNGHTVIQLNPGPPTQYVLVWIRTLAGNGHVFQSMIGEITYVQAR
jgi:hypothetical protein